MNELPPADLPPAPIVVPPAAGSKLITCECCGCSLDTHGNVLKRGERAARMLDMERDLTDANRTINDLRQQLAAVRTEPKPRESLFGFKG